MRPPVLAPRPRRVRAPELNPAQSAPPPPPVVKPPSRPTSTIIDGIAVRKALQMAQAAPAPRNSARLAPPPFPTLPASTPASAAERKPSPRIVIGAILVVVTVVALTGAYRLLHAKSPALQAADAQLQQISGKLAQDAYPE